jgi:hypothetical protein
MVVYTAVTGDYDNLRRQPSNVTNWAGAVAFVDGPEPGDRMGWQCRTIANVSDDPVRNAKIHKVLSHKYFPDEEYSLWLDGNVVVNFDFPLRQLVSEYLSDCDLAVFKHSRRTCIYQEAQTIIHQRLDDPGIVRQ